MDIHRCRFVPYPAKAINTIAFSHATNTNFTTPPSLRLALGRTGGDIEIWNPQNGSWFQETILRGGKDRSIEGLVWTQESLEDEDLGSESGALRLFSIGDSSTVTEWSLATGAPKRHANGNFGDIWCLAAQPRLEPSEKDSSGKALLPRSQLLAAGCGDGTIVLFSTEDNDLRFVQSLGKPSNGKRKVLSITWRDRNTIVAGYDDSSIRLHDVRNRSVVRNMSLGKPADGNESYVWCLRCLKDGTILSGDSSGELKIWDAKNQTLVQRLKTHEGDILDIGASENGDTIITVGVDRRTVAYKPVAKDKGTKRQRWTHLTHRRFHQHDIKTIATFESKEMSVMASGGTDTVPIVAPLRQWEDEYHRTLMNLPQRPQLCSSPAKRLIVSWWDRELLIWYISERHCPHKARETQLQDDRDYYLVSRIALTDEANISSAHISNTGDFIAVSTAASVKLFQVRMSYKGGTRTLRARLLELPPSIGRMGARVVKFSPDGHWLSVVRLNNTVVLAKLSTLASEEPKPTIGDRVIRLTRKPRQVASLTEVNILGDYVQTITNLEFSADSRVLATGDISGAVDTWVLEGHENEDGIVPARTQLGSSSDNLSDSDSDDDGDDDTVISGQKWIRTPSGSNLPQLNSAILALVFRPLHSSASPHERMGNIGLHATRHTPNPVSHEMPKGDARLVAVTSSHQIIEFDVFGCRLSDWTRRNPASCLPHAFATIKDRTMGCLWDYRETEDRLWLYGPGWLFMLDMSQDLPAPQAIGRLGNYDVLEPLGNSQKKRKSMAKYSTPRKTRNTGAGDEVHSHELYTGLGKYAQKFKENERANRQVVKMIEPMSPISDDDIDTTLRESTLALMRRNADDDFKKDSSNEWNRPAQRRTDQEDVSKLGWWLTFEYRSIFGIVPIGGAHSDQVVDDEPSRNVESILEVVVIERPLYDLDLPPRFDGGQDWET